MLGEVLDPAVGGKSVLSRGGLWCPFGVLPEASLWGARSLPIL